MQIPRLYIDGAPPVPEVPRVGCDSSGIGRDRSRPTVMGSCETWQTARGDLGRIRVWSLTP